MFEKIKKIFSKNKGILGQLPEKSMKLVEEMKTPAAVMTDRIFFLIMHSENVAKDQENIVAYAEKNIFGMPVKIIRTEDWNKDIKMQKLMPRDTILFIDLDNYGKTTDKAEGEGGGN